MKKNILITGSTDGIGFATALSLLKMGHKVIVHGRSEAKATAACQRLLEQADSAEVESCAADLSLMTETQKLAQAIADKYPELDVLINNAGVYVVQDTVTPENLDVRFAVNTLAPYLLARELASLLGPRGRIVNLSSAAQSPIQANSLLRPSTESDGEVYAQSKLALTMWTRHMAETFGTEGPLLVAVNPGSFLASKMVEQAYGIGGSDVQKGADILVQAALSEKFADASGAYFDNDSGRFAEPHSDASNPAKNAAIAAAVEQALAAALKE